MKLSKEDAWEISRGMNWVWDYCKTGNATDNASGVQEWLRRQAQDHEYVNADRQGRRPRKITVSLKVCRALAAEIARYYKNDDKFTSGIGRGFGQSSF